MKLRFGCRFRGNGDFLWSVQVAECQIVEAGIGKSSAGTLSTPPTVMLRSESEAVAPDTKACAISIAFNLGFALRRAAKSAVMSCNAARITPSCERRMVFVSLRLSDSAESDTLADEDNTSTLFSSPCNAGRARSGSR